jgi:hypothetical protein
MKFLNISRFGLAPATFLLLTTGPTFAQIGTIISPPSLVNANGFGDSGSDFAPSLVSNGADTFICVFTTNEASLSNGGDTDLFWP